MLFFHRNVLGTCIGLRFSFRKYRITSKIGSSSKTSAIHGDTVNS